MKLCSIGLLSILLGYLLCIGHMWMAKPSAIEQYFATLPKYEYNYKCVNIIVTQDKTVKIDYHLHKKGC